MPAPECRCAETAYQQGLRDGRAEVEPTPQLAAQVAALLEPWLKALAAPRSHRLLTIPEAAEQLGVSRTKVYELMYKGELASVELPSRGGDRVGRRIEQAEVERFIERNRVETVNTGAYRGR